ncbi:acetyltransferase [Cellulosimicrobium sp. NPDC057862]|uniref:acetyltransferase n=1 Tax=Cellulosimicrobium sp. NPDC057862 TaxID=3346266 RepID=UPI0036701291
MTDPLLRPARPDDTAALVDVWRRAVEATHDFLTPDDVADLEVAVRDEYLAAVDVTVAERDGRVAGFVGTVGHRVEMLFVDPDLHGQGVGRALLAEAGHDHAALEVDVNEQNPAALGFYRAQGFVVVGRSATDGQGRPFPLLHLRREA